MGDVADFRQLVVPRLHDMLKVWKDQADFNSNFWPRATEDAERFRQTEKMVLYLIEECSELMKAIQYKVHRRDSNWTPNPARIRDELTDIFKYWVSLCQVWGLTPEEMMDGYWSKSMVCRQRYSEEFITHLHRPTAVVDIDNVLADYIRGFAEWAARHRPEYKEEFFKVARERGWMSAETLGIPEDVWQDMKVEFRLSGGKRTLPVMPGAHQFLRRCRESGLNVVLLTSRPIDRYPNIYEDTLVWLRSNDLTYDCVWWAHDKAEELLFRGMKPHVKFIVDDDLSFVTSCAIAGMKTYWLAHPEEASRSLSSLVTRVTHLSHIVVPSNLVK